MTVFNLNNNQRKDGKYPLFLGQEMGLYDSVHVTYPELFKIYKSLKAKDWSEDEVDLTKSRMDFETCSKSQYDVMIKTIAWQWELDSVASRAIAPLLAPFVTNSEYWAGVSYISQNEVLHALTYSEIARQCIRNTEELFKEIENNTNITDRGTYLVKVFDELEVAGAKYKLGQLSKEEAKVILVKAVFALYCLEQIAFMASFACTFALAEQEVFLGIAKLVQKIMIDENDHTLYGKETIRIVGTYPEWQDTIKELSKEWLPDFFKECVAREEAWADYIFSEGRTVLGLTPELLKEWVHYKATPVAELLDIPFDNKTKNNPLPWMDSWMDIDGIQSPNQEVENTNYLMNSITNDIGSDELDFDL